MGHAVEYLHFKTTLSRSVIVSECNRYCEKESDSGGLYEPIQFLNKVFNSETEALDYMNTLSMGDYAQYAVQYYELKYKASKSLQDKQAKYQDLKNKYGQLSMSRHYTPETVKSEFIGCKQCGSRLAVKYLRSNHCPLCNADLCPKTTLDRLAAMEKNMEELKQQIKQLAIAENAKAAKAAKNCESYWLVRLEYHI